MTDAPEELFSFEEGRLPLLVNMPHVGDAIPESIGQRMTDLGRSSSDSDWHVDRLYDFLADLGAWRLAARVSRYVVDLNRDPAGAQYYSGFTTPPLVPLESFDDRPLYLAGEEPNEAEVLGRVQRYWQPYHTMLSSLIARIRQHYDIVVLFDCHSIRSQVPRYSSEALPDLNVGTADLTTCAPGLRDAVVEGLSRQRDYSLAVDRIFKGGFIPRHYGQPGQGVHAFQLELSMATYMDEAAQPPSFDESKAAAVRPVLKAMVEAAIGWARRQPAYRAGSETGRPAADGTA